MASLLNMSNGSLLRKGLPYDAEIEYLESSGTQYINTNINYVSTLKVETKMRLTNNSACTLFGIIHDDNGTARRWSLTTGSKNNMMYYYQNTVTHKYVSFSANIWYILILDYRYFTINGTQYDSGASKFSVGSAERPVYIFARCNNGGVNMYSSSMLEYMKIYDGSTLVRDYIPVRVGTVGYLYDKVSKQLFGNAGTGSFILGNDI